MMELLRDFFMFVRARKKYWMVPLFLTLVLLGGLIVFSQGSAFAPFIYTLF
jgi:hypothetical protein